MSDTSARSRDFDVGRVISGTFAVIGRNFLPFVAMAVLLGGLPKLLVTLVQLRFISGQGNYSLPIVGGWFAGGLVMLVAGFVLQAAIVHATVADLNGRRVVIGESLKVGLRNCLPLIGLAILLGLGVMIGFVLLIVPGVILLVMWSVAVPAKVVEKIGVTESFSRSSDLTRGRRWPIFGLLLIYVIAAWIVEIAIMAAFAPFALTKGLPASSTAIESFAQSLNVVQLIATPIAATITTLISTAGGAVLYSELRGSREGGGHEALASVFD
ncbi:hypothetical protein BH10PSE3_BH10PSE3_22630 [soil metagenome]